MMKNLKYKYKINIEFLIYYINFINVIMSNKSIDDFISKMQPIDTSPLKQEPSLMSSKYDKLYTVFKNYITHVLICNETALYKLLKTNNTTINLQHNTCNTLINPMLSNHFNLIYHTIHMPQYECKYFKFLSSLLEESPLHILHRIIYIICDFYNSIERKDIRIDEIDNYLNDITKKITHFFDEMKQSIHSSFTKKLQLTFNSYNKEYNPFHIKLDQYDN